MGEYESLNRSPWERLYHVVFIPGRMRHSRFRGDGARDALIDSAPAVCPLQT